MGRIVVHTHGRPRERSYGRLVDIYCERLASHGLKFRQHSEKLNHDQYLTKLQAAASGDTLILLDENGKEFSSVNFSAYLQKRMNTGLKRLVFIIGGPYGFSQEVYNKAQGKLSLSKMTFSHQMVHLFFIEQLYRGFTILKGEPYHHR